MRFSLMQLSGVLFAALGWGASAQAQMHALQPGLWEFKQQLHTPGQPNANAPMARMQEQLKTMSPEMRKMVEQRMASQGVALGDSGAVRICISPEQAKQDPMHVAKADGRCSYTQVNRSGDTWKGHVVCKQPPSEGDFTTTMDGPEHFTTRAVMTSQAHGKVEMQTDGRRVGGDCGALARTKPVR